MIPFSNTDVMTTFEGYPKATRDQLLSLREIIFEVATETTGVGELEETLKWRQISYLTPHTKSGSTIRIDAVFNQLAMYFNCQTTLVGTFRALYPNTLEFEDNRCVKFDMTDAESLDAIRHCIALALTYHLRKK